MAEREGGKEREVEIGFGTLFRVKIEGVGPERVDMILDPGEENWFEVAPIHEEEDGTKWFMVTGTGSSKYIGEIVGQLTKEEVVDAHLRGYEQAGFELTPEETEKVTRILSEYAQKEPRKIQIKSQTSRQLIRLLQEKGNHTWHF